MIRVQSKLHRLPIGLHHDIDAAQPLNPKETAVNHDALKTAADTVLGYTTGRAGGAPGVVAMATNRTGNVYEGCAGRWQPSRRAWPAAPICRRTNSSRCAGSCIRSPRPCPAPRFPRRCRLPIGPHQCVDAAEPPTRKRQA